MSGRAIRRIDELIVAISIPSVVFDSAIHLYSSRTQTSFVGTLRSRKLAAPGSLHTRPATPLHQAVVAGATAPPVFRKPLELLPAVERAGAARPASANAASARRNLGKADRNRERPHHLHGRCSSGAKTSASSRSLASRRTLLDGLIAGPHRVDGLVEALPPLI